MMPLADALADLDGLHTIAVKGVEGLQPIIERVAAVLPASERADYRQRVSAVLADTRVMPQALMEQYDVLYPLFNP